MPTTPTSVSEVADRLREAGAADHRVAAVPEPWPGYYAPRVLGCDLTAAAHDPRVESGSATSRKW